MSLTYTNITDYVVFGKLTHYIFGFARFSL